MKKQLADVMERLTRPIRRRLSQKQEVRAKTFFFIYKVQSTEQRTQGSRQHPAFCFTRASNVISCKEKSVSYLSGSAEGKVFPTEVSDDSCRQSVAQDIDHGPKPVSVETGRTRKPREAGSGSDITTTLPPPLREHHYLQDPVDGHYECDVIWRQAH